jgi:hypothetical protein
LIIDTELPKTGNRVGKKINNIKMKKTSIFILGLFFVFCLSTAFTKPNINSNFPCTSKYAKSELRSAFFPIDVTFTSTNGCVVHIVGDLVLGYFPFRVKSFTGTATISGSHGCPNVTLTFAPKQIAISTTAVDYSFDTDDPCALTTVTWSNAEQSYLDLLNDPGFNQALVNAIHSGSGC